MYVCMYVCMGRTFLRRMIDLLCCFRRRDHPVRLNREFHMDLLWWHQFQAEWHGVSFWLFPDLLPEADVEVSSDAAGSLGYGAYLQGQWLAGSWAPSQQLQSIAYKELFPIVLAAHVWGHPWVRKHVLFRSDNKSSPHPEHPNLESALLNAVAAQPLIFCCPSQLLLLFPTRPWFF